MCFGRPESSASMPASCERLLQHVHGALDVGLARRSMALELAGQLAVGLRVEVP